MASAALRNESFTLQPPPPVTDRPAEAAMSDGIVEVRIDGLGDIQMTADAALETAHRLMDAGLKAKRRLARI